MLSHVVLGVCKKRPPSECLAAGKTTTVAAQRRIVHPTTPGIQTQTFQLQHQGPQPETVTTPRPPIFTRLLLLSCPSVAYLLSLHSPHPLDFTPQLRRATCFPLDTAKRLRTRPRNKASRPRRDTHWLEGQVPEQWLTDSSSKEPDQVAPGSTTQPPNSSNARYTPIPHTSRKSSPLVSAQEAGPVVFRPHSRESSPTTRRAWTDLAKNLCSARKEGANKTANAPKTTQDIVNSGWKDPWQIARTSPNFKRANHQT